LASTYVDEWTSIYCLGENIEMINKLIKEIEIDIERCKNHTEINDSENLFRELVAKYARIDKEFKKDLSINGKATVHGKEIDFRRELIAIAAKLKMLLIAGDMEDAKINNNNILESKNKSIMVLLSEDISLCQDYLQGNGDENRGRELYIEITARYDGLIKDFGWGLYSYIDEYHFYDSEVSIDTIKHNLKLLLQKMIIYGAKNNQLEQIKQKNMICNNGNKVFIVHGHDEALKLDVARTLERADFEPIILHEQASRGMTIIEKIEAYTDVVYAVVLYTPCDLGRSKNEGIDCEQQRARQNVVFEHGYLISKLGRNRVSALVKSEIETPSDVSGIIYIKIDNSNSWKTELAKNMQSEGLHVDLNKFFL